MDTTLEGLGERFGTMSRKTGTRECMDEISRFDGLRDLKKRVVYELDGRTRSDPDQ